MGRKKDIEGQLNFLDMLMTGVSDTEEEQVTSSVEDLEQQEADEQNQESAQVGKDITAQVDNKVAKKRTAGMKAGGFKECTSCWCATCEHSTVGGSVPRPLGEGMRPCPACELCVNAGKAEICVIGSADEGCRHRAEKEGLV